MFYRILTYFFIFFKYIGFSKLEKELDKKIKNEKEKNENNQQNEKYKYKKIKLCDNLDVIVKISHEELSNNYILTDYLYDYQGIEV